MPEKKNFEKEIDPNFDPVVDIVSNQHSCQKEYNIFFGLDLEHTEKEVVTFEKGISVTTTQKIDFVVIPICKPLWAIPSLPSLTSTSLTSTSSTSSKNTTNLLEKHSIDSSTCSFFVPELMDYVSISTTNHLLKTSEWSNRVTVKLSPQALEGLANPQIRMKAERMIKQEMEWASHLAVPAIQVPLPTNKDLIPIYSRLFSSGLQKMHYTSIWVTVPAEYNDEKLNKDEQDPWKDWYRLRTLCDNHLRLSVVLDLCDNLPLHDSSLDRYFGENLKAITIDFNTFTTGEEGYPNLPPRHRSFLMRAFKYDVQIILKGTPDHELGVNAYVDHILDLYESLPGPTQVEVYEKPYWDYLQNPLQPLFDNLESQTYEVFEKDPVKYALYERAIMKALIDYSEMRPDNEKDKPILVMVVGAGRGPIVKACFRAATKSKKDIKLIAVEKNPNALVILKHFKDTIWKERDIEIVHQDMREWNPSSKADILVSELLGSFGDNELSPECLDGAQKFLKEGGISIPSKYTSYIAPLNSLKFHNDLQAYNDLKHWEMSYVVQIHRGYRLAEPKECFEFIHPNPDINKMDSKNSFNAHNTRFRSIKFKARETGQIHGIIGYFECILYKDVLMSIHPETKSEGMFSWFPIVFPVRNPVLVEKNQEIEIEFWRLSDRQKIWYEWCVSGPNTTCIHNPNGRSHSIFL